MEISISRVRNKKIKKVVTEAISHTHTHTPLETPKLKKLKDLNESQFARFIALILCLNFGGTQTPIVSMFIRWYDG